MDGKIYRKKSIHDKRMHPHENEMLINQRNVQFGARAQNVHHNMIAQVLECTVLYTQDISKWVPNTCKCDDNNNSDNSTEQQHSQKNEIRTVAQHQ